MPLSILYVEDNSDLREAIGVLLEGPDREVSAFDCAETAWAAAEQRHFDVLLTDVSLPQASGMELARRLLARNARQWVVLCSGFPFPCDLSRLGPKVVALSKPFELEEMQALLHRIADDIALTSVLDARP